MALDFLHPFSERPSGLAFGERPADVYASAAFVCGDALLAAQASVTPAFAAHADLACGDALLEGQATTPTVFAATAAADCGDALLAAQASVTPAFAAHADLACGDALLEGRAAATPVFAASAAAACDDAALDANAVARPVFSASVGLACEGATLAGGFREVWPYRARAALRLEDAYHDYPRPRPADRFAWGALACEGAALAASATHLRTINVEGAAALPIQDAALDARATHGGTLRPALARAGLACEDAELAALVGDLHDRLASAGCVAEDAALSASSEYDVDVPRDLSASFGMRTSLAEARRIVATARHSAVADSVAGVAAISRPARPVAVRRLARLGWTPGQADRKSLVCAEAASSPWHSIAAPFRLSPCLSRPVSPASVPARWSAGGDWAAAYHAGRRHHDRVRAFGGLFPSLLRTFAWRFWAGRHRFATVRIVSGRGRFLRGPRPVKIPPPPPGGQPQPVFIIGLDSRYLIMSQSITAVVLPDRTPVELLSFSMSLDLDAWSWQFDAALASESDRDLVAPTVSGRKIVELTINGRPFRFTIEACPYSKRLAGSAYQMRGRSILAELAPPYAAKRSRLQVDPTNAVQLVADELANSGFSFDWGGLNELATDYWQIPRNTFSYANKTPLEAVAQIVSAVGGVMRPHDWDQAIIAQARYPISPWHWGAATPVATLSDSLMVVRGHEWVHEPYYNRVHVAGLNAGVSDSIYRDGTAGEADAPMIVDPLILTHPVAKERGRNFLSHTGAMERVTMELPLLPWTEMQMLYPGDLLQVGSGQGAWRGQLVNVKIDCPSLGQGWLTLQVERHFL